MEQGGEATALFVLWRRGDDTARNQLIELLYDDLARSASRILSSGWSRMRLQPAELVNECFIRLSNSELSELRDRAHFLSIAAIAMHRVLIDHHRYQSAGKRAAEPATLITAIHQVEESHQFDDLHEALEGLRAVSADSAAIVEMKFFAGMTNEEVGAVLDVSATTIKRRWQSARAWLENAIANA